ncbi:PREDICTED: schlafen-like protein 1 [Amphimedon queenslandica]|uniref:Schlafen AlbA-2 domain-containing protein n=1 Tax=Amphimedon queenslandica TaxID=400682 RepID=A0AAN0JKY7_AMPQE|nr:PREDICTED: schlafen-like protein 1 [Amphimedon queenslandica]|eukprot:XP_019857449.1 PREDICTED: schlafen-like protein 1 [Amphimedon queenslandica]
MADSSMVYTLTPELSFSPSTARAKTTYKIGSKLVNTETRHTEYKVGNFALNNLEQHIRKYGSTFLNSGGGTLTIGIADDGTVVGVNVSSQARIKKVICDEFKAFKPSVGSSYYEVDFVPTDERDKFIIEIHVRAGEDDEIYADGEDKMYIRRDGSVQGPLWPRNIKEIVLEKFTKVLNSSTPSASNKQSLVELSAATPVLEHKE